MAAKQSPTLLVSMDALASALAMSRRQAFALVQRGVLPPPVRRGRYHLPAAASAYIEHLRAQHGDADVVALRRARAARAELELAVRKREVARDEDEPLVRLNTAVAGFEAAIAAFWPVMVNMSARIAPKLAVVRNAEILPLLDDAMRSTLKQAHQAGIAALAGRVAELRRAANSNGDGRA